MLSSISRNISLQLVSEGSLEDLADARFPGQEFDILIFDVKSARESKEIRQVIGDIAQKIIFLTDDDSYLSKIKDFPSGQAALVRKPLTYHKFAEGLGLIGIHLRKLNCWEYHQCGRGPGQVEVSGLAGCPVGSETSTNAMNEGTMGGRVCWAIGGSFCSGEKQGTFASKIINCQDCDFYKLVHEEQGQYSESINSILGRMRRKNKI
ncbi:MAG: hypothetical protein KKG47_13780 [Proteobacteria bacterium]|nr:hypothetical protein [Pseudomonadota bacterium]MBU1739079.1 hypothetical protein [Pseudomonadota bacterium]